MRRVGVIITLTLVVIAGAVIFISTEWSNRQTDRDASALAALPQRAIAPMLGLDAGAPDLVVFEDGDDGWFELETAALPLGLEIGFHGPRIFDTLTGQSHTAVYCSGDRRQGKTIWVIENGEIAQDYAFCSPRRMDLAPLRPFASIVEMTSDQRTRAEIEALIPAIASDPTRAMVAGPDTMSPYSARVVVTPPLMWFIYDDGLPRHLVEQTMKDTIRDHMGDVTVSFHRRPASNPNLALPSGQAGAGGGANMAMRQDDGYIVIPGVWAEPYEIWIECNPEACARAETLELDAALAPGRDFAGLRRAIRQVTVAPQTNQPSLTENSPSMADLEDDSVQIAAPVPVTYQIRYITRP